MSNEPPQEPDAPSDEEEQDRVARSSRDTGGDAPAAASIDEREAVAADDDAFTHGDGEDDADR